MKYYILNENKEPVLTADRNQWAEWFATTQNRIVAKDAVGAAIVSTVFLGFDHNSGDDDNNPILWETMVFSDKLVNFQEVRRCSGTIEQAKEMHAEMRAYLQTVENYSEA